MLIKRLKLLVPLLILSIGSFAQTDNLFWFAAPDVSNEHGWIPTGWPTKIVNGMPINLHITAVHATTVTIERPADNGFTTLTYNLSDKQHISIPLSDLMAINDIECYPSPAVAENKAFKISSSPGEITAYYELDNQNNRDIFALKGKNAMGTDFYVSTQNQFVNGDYELDGNKTAFSGFVIAATQNGTTIKIYRNDNWLVHSTVGFPAPTRTTAGGITTTTFNQTEEITITLNAGQTFAFRAADIAAGRHINGVRVTSDKDIVITQYDDSIRKKNSSSGGCNSNISYDLVGDQTIPIELIGKNYIVMKGDIVDIPSCDGGERIFVTTTSPGTQISLNGIAQPLIPDAGTVVSYPISANNTLVSSNNPIYVFHTTGYGGEFGGAVLPTIDACTGSKSVTFTRTNNTGDSFFLNLMARNETSGPDKNKIAQSFSIIVNGVSLPLLDSYFDYILDSSWVVLKKDPAIVASITSATGYKITPGTTATVENSKARFHLSIRQGGQATGCKYGYFSDYKSENVDAGIGGAHASKLETYCTLDPIRLVATGGQAYKWTSIRAGHPEDTIYLSSTTIADPIFSPPYEGEFRFRVTIDLECSPNDTIDLGIRAMTGPVAQFDILKNEGCSPFDPVFINRTDMDKAKFLYWNFGIPAADGSEIWVDNSTLPFPFNRPYPENFSDTARIYTVKLRAEGLAHRCAHITTKTIKVLPNVNASVASSAITGCTPLPVRFTDNTIGHIDTLNTYWDFGDYQQTYKPVVDYTFSNNTLNVKNINAKLIAYSIAGCTDTAVIPITVQPYIKANYSLTNLTGCSPFSTQVDPIGSMGVHDYHWTVKDNKGNVVYSYTHNDAFTFSHNDNTQPNPDTLFMSMYGTNSYGCADTAVTKRLVIYPEVHAIFVANEDPVCDSAIITFDNHSLGYNLVHEWRFGDGNVRIDTTGNSFDHRYFNRTSSAVDYPITLITTSNFLCSDTASSTITVYPFVKANFAVDYSTNCSPLDVKITNTSVGGNTFDWNFGDGKDSTTYIPGIFSHIYENDSDHDTTFILKLVTANSHGCSDSLKRPVFLSSRVIAAFDFDSPNKGCNPLNVSFVNNSKGKNLDYLWDFGDKTSSTSQNPPPRTYKNSTDKDTTYYVNLTVTNLVECKSNVTKTVDVYSKVTADFSIERVDSCSPFKIRIDNFSSGGITEFTWRYTEDDSITLFDFSNPDIPVYRNQTLLPIKYPVVLITRNSHDCSAAKYDTITVFPEMHADFQTDRISGCQPLLVGFSNNSNIKTGTSFFWNFGDGKYSNLVTPANHIYSNLSDTTVSRKVILQATTRYECYDDTTIQIEVFPYIYAKFSIDKPSICANEPFTIDRTATAGAVNHFYWDYDDGTGTHEKSDAIFNFTYNNTGTTDLNPKIRLTVTNAQGCDTSWTETIAVHPQVRAAFSVDNEEVCYPLATRFTNQSEPAIPLTYYWEFGDGSSSVAKNPVHAYKNFSRADDKTFTIKLTAASEFGCDSSISRTVTIHPKPLAEFSFPVAVDCPPFPVHFINGSQGTNLSYSWDFDNGRTSDEANPVETFFNNGSDIDQKNITLIATTQYNCTDTIEKVVHIYPAVNADFTASDWDGCSPLQISFDGAATNENEYYWYIDNKVFSNYKDPSYRFNNESATDKVYNIRFRAVSVTGCEADTVKQVTIYPSPLAEFLPYPQSLDFDTSDDITEITMNNRTNNQPIWQYQWDFGDGTGSSEVSASFIKKYTIWGDVNNESRIPVSLIATNGNHPQCADTVIHYVIIKPPLPRVDIGPDISGCMPLTVDFSAVTKYNHKDKYQWDFGYKGLESDKSNPYPVVFDTAGMYIVRLSVTGDGGTSWDYKIIAVHPKPVIDFAFDPKYAWLASQTEPGTPIKFFNNTTNAVNFTWEFGDGTSSNERQPQHEYKELGEFYVKLTAENEYTCWDTLTSIIPVVIDGHGYLKFPNAITIVPGAPANENYDPRDPNEDSNRRLFRPLNEGVKKYRLEIYNRWGELIYVSDDVNKGWNGYIQGKPVKQDVYVWRVTATFTNGLPYVAAGDVTVLVMQP